MRARARVHPTMLGVLVFLGSACPPPLPEPPPPEPGQRWCMYADPATGLQADEQSYAPITDPMTGLWMSACTCLCPDDHAVILAGVNGTLMPGSDAETFYEDQVALLRTAAEIACLQRVNELQMELGTTLDFDAPGTVSCQDAVVDEVPQYAAECGADEAQCEGPGTGGAPMNTDGVTADDSGTDAATSADATTDADTTATEGTGTTGGGVVIDHLQPR